MNRSEAFGIMWELLERDHGGCDDTECSLYTLINEGSDYALECWRSSGGACKEFISLYDNYFAPRKLESWDIRWMNSKRPKNYNKKVWEYCYRQALDNKEWAIDTLSNNPTWFKEASISSQKMIGGYVYLDAWVLAKESYDYLEMRSHGVTFLGALDRPAKNKWEAISGKRITKAKIWKYDHTKNVTSAKRVNKKWVDYNGKVIK